ncbi:hypothetical protein ACTFIV_006842 [Dictyostelium citrinum]
MDTQNIKYGDNDVAIIGIGLRLPNSINKPLELWESLLAGFDGIVETTNRWSDSFSTMEEISSKYAGLIDLDEWMSFDPLFFGIIPTEATSIDPQQRLLLKCTWEAFEDANIDPFKLRGTNTSVYIGTSSLDYASINVDTEETPMNIFNSNMSGVSNRISYCYDFRGTSLTIDTACSSSLNAVHLGYKSIISGESDYSIVGGCNFIMSPHTSRSFESINVTSKTGKSKAFDQDANGFVRSEGVVSIILKKMSKAIQDGDQIYSVIKGTSSNVDGNLNKGNFFAPSKQSQANNIKNAIETCNKEITNSTPISLNDIDFFELHGTSTQIGDPIECEGVSSVFKSSREKPLLIGSIKANIGHLEPASGVASLAKVALMFKHRQFVKNINFDKPNPNIKFDEWKLKVVTENTPFPNNKKVSMAINSFGITGSNACLILTEYIKPKATTTNGTAIFSTFPLISNTTTAPTTPNNQNQKYLIPISANSKPSLESYKEKLINSSKEFAETINFKDFVKYQLNSKTLKLIQRSVFIASNWEELGSTQSIVTNNTNRSGNIIKDTNKNPQLVFVFSGQGPQWSQMFSQLYEQEPIFKQTTDQIDLLLSKHYGYSILNKLNSTKDDDTITINEPILAQPSIFMIQIALVELYKHWGISASISVGHSLGEVSSAVCSGMIDLETGCFIIYHRSKLQQQTIGSGRMLVISLNQQQFNLEFQQKYPSIEITCFNSPSSIVLAGKESELQEISNILKEKETFSIFLGAQSSFHSSSQEPIKDELLKQLKDIKSTKSKIPNFSTVTTNLFNGNDDDVIQQPDEATKTNTTSLFDSNYVYENVRKPVQFEKTIKNIFNYIENKDLGSAVIFLEISPTPVLGNYIREMIPQDSNYFFIEDQTISVLSSLNKKNKDQVLEIQTSISQLYCKGYNVNFNCSSQIKSLDFQNTEYKKLSDVLFKYSWDDESYWSVAPIILNYIKNGPATNQLGNRIEKQPYQSFVSLIDIRKEPFEFLKGHSSRNRVIYPGCGYIDSILKAFPDQDLTIESMEFKSAILLSTTMKTYLSTNIIPSGKNEYRVSFHHKDKKTNKWILSCSGRFSTTKHNDEVIKKVDIEKLKSKCNFVTIQKKELYETIKYKAQLTFEGKFQSIEEVSYGHNCCLSKVPLTTLTSYDNQSFLNLCVIDSGFQPLCFVKENQGSMVFSSIENLKFYSKNIPKSAEDREKYKFVYTFTQIIEKRCETYYVSIVTMLQDGTVLFFSPLVVFSQLTPYKNQFLIESPNDNLYKICYQSKDSTLPSPLILKDKFDELRFETTDKQSQVIKKALSNCLFAVFKRNNNLFTKAEIKSQSIDYLIEKYCLIIDNDDDNDGIDDNSILANGGVASIDDLVLASTTGKKNAILNNGKRSLAKLIFQILKSNVDLIDWNNIATFTKTISKQQLDIIQAVGNLIVTPLSVTNQVTESNSIDNRMKIKQYELISNTIANDLIKPIVNNSILFRILEINSGFGYLSEMIINKINQLLVENENSYEIEIEFTFTLSGNNQDDNEQISNSIKEKLANLLTSKSSVSIIFKSLNLNESFLEQEFNPSYYDLIVLSNLSTITNLNQSIEYINSILYPNGHLIIIDTKYQSNFQDYEIIEQFLIFDNFGGIVYDDIDWNQIFQDNNLNNIIATSNIQPHIIQVQKPKLMDKEMGTLDDITGQYDQIVLIGDYMQDTNEDFFINPIMDINKHGTDVYRIKTIEAFEKHCSTILPTDKSVLIFISAMNNLSLDNYKKVNLDYIKINQYLLSNKLGCTFILATRSALKESTNALAASLIGSFRYFSEFSSLLNLYSFDLGEDSFTVAKESPFKWLNMAVDLLDPKKHIQREYIFRNGNNETFFERIGKIKRVKSNYQSTSYLDNKEDSLVARLNQNLEYQLEAKQTSLKENEIEVQVVATGINFKDSLIFRNLVPPILVNHEGDFSKPEFGFECSGIVSRIGSKVTSFKVGDSVLGLGWKSTSSHSINTQDAFQSKPDNISFVEAASIPLVYCTSFYSLFYSGNLSIEKNETVLIHQASGGIGLACLNILKARGFKSKLYVTVGSKEKEDYLREQYGDFITGIYSSRNTDFLENIKTDLSSKNNERYSYSSYSDSFSEKEPFLPFLHTVGQLSISSNIVLGSLDLLLQQPTLSSDTKIVASFDFDNLPKPSRNGSNNLSYKFDYFTNPIQSKQSNCSNDNLSIREEILAKFSEFLSVDDQSKINLDIKLLDYGADSMVIVELKNYLDKTYTPNILSIQQLQNVTINQLIQSVTDAMNKLNGNEKKPIKKSNKLTQQKQTDWVKEIKLDSTIKPTDEMIKLFKQQQKELTTATTSNTVFLTGSSGFIGIYILFYLIKSVNCKIVYCLLRRKTIEEATTFLIENFKVHQLYDQLTTNEINKIKAVLGDYTLDSFGLSVDQYTNLSKNVDLIINSAASVNYLMDYEDSKVESVEGVLQCLRFSCHNKLKKLVQISALGIYSGDKRDNLDDYTFAQIDPKIIESKNSFINGYFQGKIVSEYHIKEATNRGIPCCIIRLPFIGPNPSTGLGNNSDLLQSLLRSCYAMSTYPKQESILPCYTTPITWAAQNLSFISMNAKCWSTSSNNPSISENLTCYNLFGESICFNVLLTELAAQLKWKPATSAEFLKKLKSFQNEPSCNRVHVVLKNSKNLSVNIYIPGNHKLNPTLKQLLQSNNTYEGWKITPEMILTHLSFTFNKKSNN